MSDNPPPVRCPNCQAEVPVPTPAPAPSRARRWWSWLPLAVVGGILLAGLVLGLRYKGQIQTVLNFANEVTGSTALSVAGLVVAAFLVLCLLSWLVLPLLLVGAWMDLRRRRVGAAGNPDRGAGVANGTPDAVVAPGTGRSSASS